MPGPRVPAPRPPLARRAVDVLMRHGLPPEAVVLLALSAAALAATALAMAHHGVGALIGAPALALAWLARQALVYRPGRYTPGAPHGFVEGMAPLVGGLLAAGLVLDAATRGSPLSQLLRTGLLVALLWRHALPHAAGQGGGDGIVWTSTERLGVLLGGCLLGHPELAVFVVLLVLAVELAVPLLHVWPGGSPLGPRVLAAFGGAHGRAPAAVRHGLLGLSAVLFLVFSRESGWRF